MRESSRYVDLRGGDDRLAMLIGEGIVSPPERALDASALRAEHRPMLVKGDSAVQALLADREDSP